MADESRGSTSISERPMSDAMVWTTATEQRRRQEWMIAQEMAAKQTTVADAKAAQVETSVKFVTHAGCLTNK